VVRVVAGEQRLNHKLGEVACGDARRKNVYAYAQKTSALVKYVGYWLRLGLKANRCGFGKAFMLMSYPHDWSMV